ncbi:MAG: STAS/SEC14 domain-containing protein [Bernardetiaceae bacterium]|jgi:hypothetical protein|nr:STAS/SEC14 domain-containing protein [Bernardetiaceae bacterium]
MHGLVPHSPSENGKLELKNEGGYVYLILEPDHQNKWLYYRWRGFLLMDELKTGFAKVLDLVEKEQFTAVLADHANIVGPWNEVVDWLANEWTPRANQAGLTHLAIRTASDLFSNISLEMFLMDNRSPHYHTKVFESLDDAKHWLRQAKGK